LLLTQQDAFTHNKDRTSVFEWRKWFKEECESLLDERKGRSSPSRAEERTEVIEKCLAED
jgi:hypothetical protein